MFSSSAKLSSATRAEPPKGLFTPKPAPKPKPPPALKIDLSGIPDDELPPLQPLPAPRKKLLPKMAHAGGSCSSILFRASGPDLSCKLAQHLFLHVPKILVRLSRKWRMKMTLMPAPLARRKRKRSRKRRRLGFRIWTYLPSLKMVPYLLWYPQYQDRLPPQAP